MKSTQVNCILQAVRSSVALMIAAALISMVIGAVLTGGVVAGGQHQGPAVDHGERRDAV